MFYIVVSSSHTRWQSCLHFFSWRASAIKIQTAHGALEQVQSRFQDLSIWTDRKPPHSNTLPAGWRVRCFMAYLSAPPCFPLCSYWAEDGGQEQVPGCTYHPPVMRRNSWPDLTLTCTYVSSAAHCIFLDAMTLMSCIRHPVSQEG